MRRPFAALIAPVVVLTGLVTGALAASPTVSRTGQATVTLADCHPADDMADRYASFTGQMRTVPGAKRMAMHFTLLERLGGGLAPFKSVSLPDLKPWRRSKPGARAFIYTQRVTALRDGGAYRMRVQFRWYDAHKTLLRTTTLRSRTCHQPAPLPDLTITSIGPGQALAGGQRMYSVTVANDGQGEASDVPVELKVDGAMVGSAMLDLLPGQESSVVQIQGPQCAFTVRAVADPDRLIPETDESNNALTVACAQATS
jgi:CARDB